MKVKTVQISGHGQGDNYDVAIIGAGLAGLAAADRLRQTGLSVVVLESSRRLGGRTFGEYWQPAGRAIDLGGTWLLPAFLATYKLLDEFNIATRNSPDEARALTHFSSGIAEERTLNDEETAELKRVSEDLEAIIEAHPLGISAQEALDSVPMSERIYDWHSATQRYLVGASLEDTDARHLLVDHEDLINPEHYSAQIAGTTLELVRALAARSEARIVTDTAVTSITLTDDIWTIRTIPGSTFTATHVIVAVPRNTLRSITLAPAPEGPLQELIDHPHVGASRKDWFVLDHVTDHFRVFSSQGPFGYFRSEVYLGEGQMLAVGLAPRCEGVPTMQEFEKAIQAYLPGAKIAAHTRHDWVKDEWANGTWLGPRPGDYRRNLDAQSPHERLQFVGADFSTDFPGTIEGAIRTGTEAAESILA